MALRHLLPAIAPQLIVGTVLSFPHAVLHEASITFLGFGLPPDEPAIGVILAESMGYLTDRGMVARGAARRRAGGVRAAARRARLVTAPCPRCAHVSGIGGRE